jgi:presenilin 1
MKILVGYMMFCSCTLLGILGANLFSTAIYIYEIPVDIITFYLFMANFAAVGVMAIFWGKGIPKSITQMYLICTSVILAWHLSYFDAWSIWTLLFMLALYDLCAVLTPCGPLKALVNLMSKEGAPEMPGLLYEAELPPEARRPKPSTARSSNNDTAAPTPQATNRVGADLEDEHENASIGSNSNEAGAETNVPLAIAKVYQLPVSTIPPESMKIFYPSRFDSSNNASASPLLTEDEIVTIPDAPTPEQLCALVTVCLPLHGGRIEKVTRRSGRQNVYLEKDRHGEPKRILWVDRRGKVFAEMKSDDEDAPEQRNSIRLGLGDFIFYSVLVAKAAQYSFPTFCACALVILAGLGGTLVLLSVYGHALPALPISIFLGIIAYILTRLLVEPYIEFVMSKAYYV